MKSTISGLLLLTLGLPTVMSTIHTTCFTYFLHKDGCVVGTPGDKRCGAATGVVSVKNLGSSVHHKRALNTTSHHLERRYDAYYQVPGQLIGVEPVCPKRPKLDNSQPGACLWLGKHKYGVDKAGWVNYNKTSNCEKQVWIQKQSDPSHSVYAPVVAGCHFTPPTLESACFQIGLTTKTFMELNPSPDEIKKGAIDKIRWDFDNTVLNKKPWFGPV